jgi:colicin import membrane protein
MQETMHENEAKMAAHREAAAKAKALETEKALAYAALLEKQEQDRTEALRQTFERTHLRAAAAGDGALKAAVAREALEEARIAQLQRERDAELAAAQKAKTERANRAKEDVVKTLGLQLAAKAASRAAAAAELQAHMATVLAADAAAAAADAAAIAARQAAAKENAQFLQRQAEEKKAARSGEHHMSNKERLLNKQMLQELEAATQNR